MFLSEITFAPCLHVNLCFYFYVLFHFLLAFCICFCFCFFFCKYNFSMWKISLFCFVFLSFHCHCQPVHRPSPLAHWLILSTISFIFIFYVKSLASHTPHCDLFKFIQRKRNNKKKRRKENNGKSPHTKVMNKKILIGIHCKLEMGNLVKKPRRQNRRSQIFEENCG